MSSMLLSPGQIVDEGRNVQINEGPREDLSVKLICPYCQDDPPYHIEDFSSGTIVCGSCATVLMDNVVDTRSEWRNFANDDSQGDDPSRVGEARNVLLNGSQLTTDISFATGDSRSRDLNRAQHRVNEDKGNKALQEAYHQITTYCEAINLQSSVQNTAKLFYKTAMQNKTLRGKSQEAIIAGCIFLACRQSRVPRTFKEITALTKVPKKDIGRIFKNLESHFREHKVGHTSDISGYKQTDSTSASEYCGRFANNLGLSPAIGIMASDYADKIIERGILAGRSPLSIAAVSVFAITNFMGFEKSAKEVGEAVQVSDGTIRAAWRKVYEQRLNLINADWISKGGDVDKLPAA